MIKRYLVHLLMLCLLYCYALGFATQQHEDLDFGAYVITAKKHDIVIAEHPTRAFIPASTLKLFVAVAALKQLGPDFQYQTTLWHAPVHDQQQDYILRMAGDPSFNQADLATLLSHLPKRINGQLIIDGRIFDSHNVAPGVTWDEQNICYAAPSSGFMLDENCVKFQVKSQGLGHAVTDNLAKDAGISLHNHAKAATTPGCTLHLRASHGNHYQLSGCMPAHTHLPFAVAVRYPQDFLIAAIQRYCKQQHILIKGGVHVGKIPKGSTVITKHASAPLADLVKHMLKNSDSLYANAILKTLGHHRTGKPGSWYNGIYALKTTLRLSPINWRDVHIVDGSGESRYNLVTPKALVQLLRYAYQLPHVWPAFKAALPISHTDGTLEHRLSNLKGKVYAKTGTFAGTSTLAGYLFSGQKTYIFSIMINNGLQDDTTYWQIENILLTRLDQLAQPKADTKKEPPSIKKKIPHAQIPTNKHRAGF